MVGLWQWASQRPDLHLGPCRLARTDEDPHLPAEDITKRGKVLGQWIMGRWSHFPHLSVFILHFIIPS
jgi:hypothetical protein